MNTTLLINQTAHSKLHYSYNTRENVYGIEIALGNLSQSVGYFNQPVFHVCLILAAICERKSLTLTGFDQVTCASFYYLDKFILVSEGPRLQMMRWFVPEAGANMSDIERLRAKPTYTCTATVTVRDTHSISAFSVHNNFHSHLAALACSNRSLQLVDMSTGTVIGCVPVTSFSKSKSFYFQINSS